MNYEYGGSDVEFWYVPHPPGNQNIFFLGGIWQLLKRKSIYGRTSPGVDPAAYFISTTENFPGPDIVSFDRLTTLS